MTHLQRNAVFDVIRGFAVLLMVFANSASLYSGVEMPLLIRIICSMAAPLFIMVSGFMVSQIIHKHHFRYFAIKGAFILFVAVCIDIFIIGIKPFEGFDVLYLIGLAVPIAAMMTRYHEKVICALMIIILLLDHLLLHYFGYKDVEPHVVSLSNLFILPEISSIHYWLISGWFPVFPWLGYTLAGVLLGKLYQKAAKEQMILFNHTHYLLGSVVILLIGLAMMITFPAAMKPRMGYFEIYYPMSTGVFIMLLGLSSIFMSIAYFAQHNRLITLLIRPLGVSVLTLYMLHFIVIFHILHPLITTVNSLPLYSLIFMLHIGFLLAITVLLQKIKQRYKNLPTVAYWFIGK